MVIRERKITAQPRIQSGISLSRSVDVSHLSWQFDADTTRQISGKVTSREIGPLRVSWIDLSLGAGEWHGRRTQLEVQAVPEPYLIIVMPLTGTMKLSSGDEITEIKEHELAIWDSTQELSFDIGGQQYEQISVLVPQRMLRASESSCAILHCARLNQDNVLSELCVQHMSTLAKFLNGHLRPYELSLSSVTTSLVDSMIASLVKSPRDRDQLISEIKNYIECYLTDEELSPASIAAAFEVSTRYIHKLFEHDGNTIGAWILDRRLERSVDDLLRSELSITETAFRWGFKDLGHYSRSFKNHFKTTPSDYRKQTLSADLAEIS